MPSAEEIAGMAGMTGAAGGAFSGGGRSYRSPGDARGLYEQWQQALAELEGLKGGQPQQTVAPQYRVNPQTGQREYNIGGKWAQQHIYEDPAFQATVVEPWMEKERTRMADEYNKQFADVQQRAAMHEYDYNDFMRRQEELKQGATVGKSTYGRPQGGGGMGSTTRR